MQRPSRNSWWLFIGLVGISIFGWFTNTFPPKNIFFLALFFLILFATASSLSLYILNNVRRSLLVSIGVAGFLLLRYMGLRELFYPVLLLASLVSLELFFQKR